MEATLILYTNRTGWGTSRRGLHKLLPEQTHSSPTLETESCKMEITLDEKAAYIGSSEYWGWTIMVVASCAVRNVSHLLGA